MHASYYRFQQSDERSASAAVAAKLAEAAEPGGGGAVAAGEGPQLPATPTAADLSSPRGETLCAVGVEAGSTPQAAAAAGGGGGDDGGAVPA